ncbi:hypothetical protein SOVF_193530, partial [Spinacia oleracea]
MVIPLMPKIKDGYNIMFCDGLKS